MMDSGNDERCGLIWFAQTNTSQGNDKEEAGRRNDERRGWRNRRPEPCLASWSDWCRVKYM